MSIPVSKTQQDTCRAGRVAAGRQAVTLRVAARRKVNDKFVAVSSGSGATQAYSARWILMTSNNGVMRPDITHPKHE